MNELPQANNVGLNNGDKPSTPIRELIGDVAKEITRAPNPLGSHDRQVVTRNALINAVKNIDGDVDAVGDALNLLSDQTGFCSSDDIFVAKTVAQMNLDRRAPTKLDRASSVVASILMRAVVDDWHRPIGEQKGVLKAIEGDERWSPSIRGLVRDLSKVLFLPTMDVIIAKPVIDREDDYKNKTQFSYVQKLMARVDPRVIMIMCADWIQRLRKMTRDLTPESFAGEPEDVTQARFKEAVAIEGYGLPFFRELGNEWGLHEVKDRLFLARDPESYWALTGALPPLDERKKIEIDISNYMQKRLFEELRTHELFDDISSPEDINVKCRFKDLAEIDRKMRKKISKAQKKVFYKLNARERAEYFKEVRDLLGVRDVLSDVYDKAGAVDQDRSVKRYRAVLDVTERIGIPIPGRRREHLDGNNEEGSSPNYTALHTGIIMQGRMVEVQVCSRETEYCNDNDNDARHARYKNFALHFPDSMEITRGPVKAAESRVREVQKKGRDGLLGEEYDRAVEGWHKRLKAHLNGEEYKDEARDQVLVSDKAGALWEMVPDATLGHFAATIHTDLLAARSVVINGERMSIKNVNDILMPLAQGDRVCFEDIVPVFDPGLTLGPEEIMFAKGRYELMADVARRAKPGTAPGSELRKKLNGIYKGAKSRVKDIEDVVKASMPQLPDVCDKPQLPAKTPG